ncbi:S8 family serine peptidase [Pseudidiomarina mangrovi]|uniref:S8 family serine peptidase n=1 Tax=Pseudidiomarina mangrovi TaxID=2487133 RepID=UPI000FCA6556|nr:S8 family serine peptidase [Pseudidiomarina mangrovi]
MMNDAQLKRQKMLGIALAVSQVIAIFMVPLAGAQALPPLLPEVIKTTEQIGRQTERLIRDQRRHNEELEQRLATPIQVVELLTDSAVRTLRDNVGNALLTEVTQANDDIVIAQEWLIAANAEVYAALIALGADLVSDKQLGSLGLRVIRFRVPQHLDSAAQLKYYLPDSGHASLSRHFVYQSQTAPADGNGPVLEQNQACASRLKIGMVDTQIMTEHGAFAHQPIVQRSFIDSRLQQPKAHGTAVAGLMVGRDDGFTSLIPNATVYNGAIFHRHDALQQGAALISLLEALNWLAEHDLKVINMSLTGPHSPLLATAVSHLASQDIVLVAAAGNQGPAAPALFPAAYPEVIAVSASDGHGAIYRWANQGDHIDFTSLGVRVVTARRDGKIGVESGTSMAAPVVAAVAACWLTEQPQATLADVREFLEGIAEDVGQPGHDRVFGHGLLPAKTALLD